MKSPRLIIAAGLVSFCALFAPALSFASQETEADITEKASAFRQYGTIPSSNIVVPTLVEVPMNEASSFRSQIAILDDTEKVFVPHAILDTQTSRSIQVHANPNQGESRLLNDKDLGTYAQFDLPENLVGRTVIEFSADEPFSADALAINLGQHVALPEKIEIRADVDGSSKIVLAETDKNAFRSGVVYFPETKAARWQVLLRYGQPLRITEISLRQTRKKNEDGFSLRFLMQPSHSYRVFANPDRPVFIRVGESGNLRADKDVVRLSPPAFVENANYRESDLDKDGISDVRDNCVSVANPDQTDIDGNLRGDACDDFDRDGILNSRDNCPNKPNASQIDTDGDRLGDVCDHEESRVTEKYPWLSWIAFAGVAVCFLFFFFRIAKGLPTKSSQD